ncbi:MAG: ester cyclase [Acidobacteria bacterium]|nr:ester cyclase [Acidobacteriota bacterium]
MDQNKTLIKEYFAALSGGPKPAALVAKYVDDRSLMQHIDEVEAAFPNYELRAEDMIAEGDKVVVRGEFQGVHAGPFAGIAPTGVSAKAGLIIVYRIKEGRIVEHWLQFDLFGLLSQLK